MSNPYLLFLKRLWCFLRSLQSDQEERLENLRSQKGKLSQTNFYSANILESNNFQVIFCLI